MLIDKLRELLAEAIADGNTALASEIEAAIALLEGGTATPQSGGGSTGNPPPQPPKPIIKP